MLKRIGNLKSFLFLLFTLSLLITAPTTHAANIITVTKLEDNFDFNNGGCTLREAIYAAWNDETRDGCAAGNGADTIVFGVQGTITLEENIQTGPSELTIQGPIIISGKRQSCENGNTLDCHNLLHINSGADITLINVTLKDGITSGAGGAILMVGGSLNVIGSSFIGNKAGNDGGAIRGGDVQIVGSNFTANEAGASGGALHLTGSYERHISGSVFNGNLAGTDGDEIGKGGAIYVEHSGGNDQDTFITDVIFNGNVNSGEQNSSSTEGGGAVYNRVRKGTLFIERTAFNGNIAQNTWGGAIYNTLSANLDIQDASFNGNISGDGDSNGFGGAIYNAGYLFTTRSFFAGNIASLLGQGGALGVSNRSEATLSNSTLFANTAGAGSGGAIYLAKENSHTPLVELRNVTLSDNDAVQGGAIYNDEELVRLFNTIVHAGIGSSTCAGTVPENGGSNLQFPGTACGSGLPSADPVLEGPAFNGGPLASLLSLTLGAGSPAIDAGSNAVCAASPVGNVDQRGEIRPSDGSGNGTAQCDIGAVENDGASPGFGSAPVQPGPLNVGSATVGMSVSNSLAAFETGNFELTLSSPTLSGANAGDFDVVTAFPITIADGGAAAEIEVSCTPTAVGPRSATLTFNTSDGSHSQVSYDLLCAGTPVPQPGFGSSPAAPGPVDFDLVFVGFPQDETIIINEIGEAGLTISNPQLGGLHPGDFTVNTAFPITINNGGAAVDVELSCDPTTTGLRLATLTLTTNDPEQPTVLFNLVCTAVTPPDPPLTPGPGTTGVTGAYAIATSPDGQHVYATAGDELKQYERTADGTLSPLITNGVPGYGSLIGLAASPDGQHVYVTSFSGDALITYERDETTGLLTFVELLEEGGTSSGCSPCLIIDGLDGAAGVAVSGDGQHVYVVSTQDDALARFDRDDATGQLLFRGSLKEGEAGVTGLNGPRDIAISPDGAHLYVTSYWGPTGTGGTVAVFERHPLTGALTFVTSYADGQTGFTHLDGAAGVAVSPDGGQVYVAAQGDDAITVFQRDSFAGTLLPLQTEEDGTRINGLDGASDVQVSPDGKYVYVTAFADNGLCVFERLVTDGRLLYAETYLDGSNGGNLLAGPRRLAVSPDNRDVYVTANLDNALGLLQMANPTPTLDNLSPASAQAGSGEFTLTVHGTDFAAGSEVLWNGTPRTTTFVNEGQVKAMIPASAVSSAGTAVITVNNPTPGGGPATNSLTFTITPPDQNPIPTLNELNPQGAEAGSGDITLDLLGANFLPASQVQWNGSDRPTTFIAPNYVRVTLPASDVAQPGTAGITVVNPAPGGGSSNLVAFVVAAPGENPVPALTGVSPATAVAQDPTIPGTKMTLHGSNFIPDSQVLWNGSPRYTTFVSAAELRISLLAGDVAQANSASIQVHSPAPGGGTSNSLTFLVTAAGDNPLPSVTGFGYGAGGAGVTLILRGDGFTADSQVQWNGANRATTYISSEVVSIELTIAEFGAETAVLQVENPAPSGGTSNLFLYQPVRVYLPMVLR
ncbi:MAG: beta-propeller fold lactonase family protein [Ardenticatenaceae bacterium]|nr:beta-propeller fold lactonase family protein [Ardenticatenaceae bacterium]